MNDPFIADAQLHVWAADSPDRPWPDGRAGEAQRPYPVEAESLLFQMDLAGVDRAVLVPPSWEGDRNDLALDAARRWPDRFGVMGRLAIDDPSNEELMETWTDQPGMLGIRLTFHKAHFAHLLEPGVADWFWSAAERCGIPLMMLASDHLDLVDRIASEHPGLRITLDHLGLAFREGPRTFERLDDVCALAARPNVSVKVSGVPSISAETYPFADTSAGVRRLFSEFGPDRTFWGTDLTRMSCTYQDCINQFTQTFDWLSGDDLAGVMGRSLCTWLRWSLDDA